MAGYASAPDPESVDAVIALVSRTCSRLEGYRLGLIRYAGIGDRSALSASLGLSRGEVAQLERTAERLAGMTALQDALQSGVVSVSKARIVAEALTPGRLEAGHAAETDLLGLAATLPPAALVKALDRWGREVDTLNGTPTGERLYAERSLEFYRRHSGMSEMIGRLDPESGELIQIAIDAKAKIDWQDEPAAEHQTRSHTQRRVDALTGICTDWLTGIYQTVQLAPNPTVVLVGSAGAAGAAGAAGTAGVAGVTVGTAGAVGAAGAAGCTLDSQPINEVDPARAPLDTTLSALPAAPRVVAAETGPPGPRPGSAFPTGRYTPPRSIPHLGVIIDLATLRDRTGVAVTERGAVLDPDTARRIACDCGVSRILTNGPSAVLEAGREQRVVTGPLRKILVLRDQGCRWSGCNAPPNRCQAHHLTHWANGGATNTTNCALLCPHHHHLTHEGHWQISGNANTTLTFTSPTGITLTSHPPGQPGHATAA